MISVKNNVIKGNCEDLSKMIKLQKNPALKICYTNPRNNTINQKAIYGLADEINIMFKDKFSFVETINGHFY